MKTPKIDEYRVLEQKQFEVPPPNEVRPPPGVVD